MRGARWGVSRAVTVPDRAVRSSYVPKPAPTLGELVALAHDLGLRLEGGAPESVPAPYVPRPGAFLAEAEWRVPFFAARREAAHSHT